MTRTAIVTLAPMTTAEAFQSAIDPADMLLRTAHDYADSGKVIRARCAIEHGAAVCKRALSLATDDQVEEVGDLVWAFGVVLRSVTA